MSQTVRLPLGKKILFSAFSVTAFFVLLEIGLTIVGLGEQDSNDDPFVGFAGYVPLLEQTQDENARPILKTSKNKLNWFNAIEFSPRKPPNTYRIFCLGGSTTYGHPYWDNTSYSRWLREMLPVVDASKRWEVINAGGISYASYRVAGVMDELAQYEPDAFIVFSAHNEFLERRTYASILDSPVTPMASVLSKLRTWHVAGKIAHRFRPETRPAAWQLDRNELSAKQTSDQRPATKPQLPAEVDEMLNHTVGPVDYHRDAAWQAGVVRHYEANLNRMVEIADRSNAKLFFVVPASNTKDCSPFKSEADPSLDRDELDRLKDLQTRADESTASEDWKQAETAFQAMLRIDPGLAEPHFRLGKILIRENRFDEAEESFFRAVDTDVCPLRAVTAIKDTIRRVAAKHRVPIIDFESRLALLARLEQGHACLGQEYFLDHVHPTIDVHRRLALWMVEALQADGIVRGSPLSDASHTDKLADVRRRIEAEIDPMTEGIGLRNLAKTFHWAGRYEESAPLAENALKLLGADPESRFVHADSLKNLGRTDEALEEYEKLMQEFPDYVRAYHPYGELLAREGWYRQAKGYLLLAFAGKPDNASIAYWMGLCHLELGEFDLAAEALALSDQLYPNDPGTLFCLAQSQSRIGRQEEARGLLQRLIDTGYDSPTIRQELEAIDTPQKP